MFKSISVITFEKPTHISLANLCHRNFTLISVTLILVVNRRVIFLVECIPVKYY